MTTVEEGKHECTDMDFESQNILDQNRSKIIDNDCQHSCLSDSTLQFKKPLLNDITNEETVDDLQFDCEFESGNIGQVVHYKGSEYDITIRGDTNNPKQCVFFYFRIRGGIAGQRVICHISNYSKPKALYSDGFTPIIRSSSKPVWIRMPKESVRGLFKCNRHKKNCFTFSYIFDKTGDSYFFSYAFPYTYSYLQKFLGDIEKLNKPFIKRELLTRSIEQRRVDCLRIEEIVDDHNNNNSRPVIVFSSRVHPGETPCSYVCHGLIEFLISNHEIAKFVRRNLTILIIPMLNPDGVFIGNYRSTSLGFDLNRHWQNPTFIQHPTICSLKYLLRQLDINNKLDIYMDLHAHTNATNGFMYCNPSKHAEKNDHTTIFPRLLDLHCKQYLFSKTKFCSKPKKIGSARRAMEDILSETPLCYTFEVSFWKSHHKSSLNTNLLSETYNQETYKSIGRCMIQVLNDMYRLPKHKRNDLNQYNFKNKNFMKGDTRRNLKKQNKTNTKSADMNVSVVQQ